MIATRRLAADDAGIADAAALLAAGATVAVPTETVYGLAADATNGPAVAAIYAAKGRPRFNPLIAHVVDMAMAREHALFSSPDALTLADRFWPGPLTLVLPARPSSGVSALVRAGLDSIALRVPAHPAALSIIRQLGQPIAAPSANRSGHVSPTSAEHVLADLDGRIAAVVDAGPSPVGVESTIVSCLETTPVLLRAGGVPRQAIEAALGHALANPGRIEADAPVAPGLLVSHYAPRAMVRLNAASAMPGEAWLGFAGIAPGAAVVAARDLSERGDLVEAAANLFGHLRALDLSGAARIAVAPIPDQGLGEAINDRLRRAAAER